MEKEVSNPGLAKSFGLMMAIVLVVSAIIGSGVFKKVAPMAEMLHQPWLVILAWLLAGLIILFGVLSIGELGAMFPHAGGPFSWLEMVYGKTVSFLYGWSCFTVVQTASIASIAFVFAGALDTFVPLPVLNPSGWESASLFGIYPFRNLGAKIVSCLLIIILTAVNIRGTRKGGNLSLLFTFLITVSIIAIICLAFGSRQGSAEIFLTSPASYPESGFTVMAFISAMVLAMRSAFWAYEGWIALGFIGEELKSPVKNLPRAMTIGIVAVIIIYLLINTAYLYVMPVDELVAAAGENENSIAAVLVIDRLLGRGGAYVVSGMILISTLGCTNATILVSARIYYAMARKGLFFRKAAQIHPTRNTPDYSLKYQCIWACVLVFSGSFDMLTDLVVTTAFVFFGLIVCSVIILRIRRSDIPRPYRTPGYPLVPAVFVLFCIVLLLISLIESPQQALIGLILVLSGLPFYYYWRKRPGKMLHRVNDRHEDQS